MGDYFADRPAKVVPIDGCERCQPQKWAVVGESKREAYECDRCGAYTNKILKRR